MKCFGWKEMAEEAARYVYQIIHRTTDPSLVKPEISLYFVTEGKSPSVNQKKQKALLVIERIDV
jgi:hypothetical protein